MARPAIGPERLSRDGDALVVYELKHPVRDGTTHVLFEPLDFIARLAALVPRPRTHLVRFHGLFAPNACHRRLVCARADALGCGRRREHDEPTVAGIRGIDTVEDSRGTTLGLVDPASTSGHLLPNVAFAAEMGASLEDFHGRIVYTGGPGNRREVNRRPRPAGGCPPRIGVGLAPYRSPASPAPGQVSDRR